MRAIVLRGEGTSLELMSILSIPFFLTPPQHFYGPQFFVKQFMIFLGVACLQ